MKVLAVANSMGYQPNSYARGIAKKSFGSIGLLLSTNSASATLANGTSWAIQEELLKRSLHLVVGQLPDAKLTDEGVVPRLLSEWAVDGLLISYTHAMPPKMLELTQKNRVPSIWINSKLDSDCVFPDELRAGRNGTEYLLRLGHKRIAYLGFPSAGHYSVADRRDGYIAAMRAAGLAPRFLSDATVPDDEWMSSIMALLSTIDRPTAVITYSSAEAEVALLAAARLGVNIPGDLSLLAIRDMTTPVCGVHVSTLEVPVYKMGHRAVQMVCAKSEGLISTLPAEAVPYSEVCGATCILSES